MTTKSTANINDVIETKKAESAMTQEVAERKNIKKDILTKLSKEKKVQVTGSPFYRPYFGNNMPIKINGIGIYVPLDGQPHNIPQSFANIFYERIARVDANIQSAGIMNNNIEESYAGENTLLSGLVSDITD